MIGPEPPLALWLNAAVQLHQTGHSSIVQHFPWVKVGRADGANIDVRDAYVRSAATYSLFTEFPPSTIIALPVTKDA